MSESTNTEPESNDARIVRPKSSGGGLIELAVDRPIATMMFVLAAAVFGYVSLAKLPTTLLPKISYPSLTIRTEYPGSAPAEVEELITKTIENNVSVISNLTSFRSISRAGVSDVILEFEWNTNMSFAAQDVREKVDTIRAQLPQDVKKPLLLKYDPTLDPIMRLGLYGGDLARMRYYAEEELKKQLESIPGIAAVRVKGGFETEIRVDLSDAALEQHRLTHSQIAQRLTEENINLASGILRSGDVEYLVRTLNEFRSVDEIRELVVATFEGRLIRLGDVATVREAVKEPDVVTRINGKPSVEIGIFKEDAANIVDVSHAVKRTLFGGDWETSLVGGELDKARIEAKRKNSPAGGMGGVKGSITGGPVTLAENLPHDMTLRLLSDQSRFIEKSIDEVKSSGMQGAWLSIIILLAFLRKISATAIIAFSIPISVIVTFGPMYKWDVSLNIMSLGGLAMGIGMVVDASIVVLEAIDRYREEGRELRLAAILGTREVAGAVFASVLTTIAVFLPIVFVRGIAGEIFKDQSLTVVFSQIASLLIAIYAIPLLAARLGRRKGERASTAQEWLQHWFKAAADHTPITILRWHSVRSLFVKRREEAGVFGTIVLWMSRIVRFILFPLFFLLEFFLRSMFALLVLKLIIVGAIVIGVHRLLSLLLRPFAWLFDRCWAMGLVAYRLVLVGALKARPLVILLVMGLTWLAYSMKDDVGLELIPEVHSGEIIVEVPLPVGTSLDATSEVAKKVEAAIDREVAAGRLEIHGYSTVVGVARDEIAPAGEGAHTAKVHVLLVAKPDMARVEEDAKEIIRAALKPIPEIGAPNFTAPKLFTFQNPLEVQIKGDNLERIAEVAELIEARARTLPELKDVRTTLQEGSPEYVIEYDRVQLSKRGLTLGQAAATLRDKIKGVVPTRYSVAEDNKRIDILMRIPEEKVTNLRELENVRIGSMPNGGYVRLSEVATVTAGRGPSEIRHVRGERTILLTATPSDSDLKSASAAIARVETDERRSDPTLFEGVLVNVGGQTAEAERSTTELLFALAIALALVYIVMAAQFESLLDPLVIMITSVFAGVGVVFTLVWLSIPASVVVFIGCILLAGIVVNNAIVLIDYANRLHRDGTPRHEAIIAAGQIRMRPILMTTLTTVLGLLPMALSPGEGSEMRTPMAITVIAGMTSGTILTLVIIPVIYLAAHTVADAVGRLFKREPTA